MNDTIEKIYWTIGETAKLFQVKPCTVRYWADEFDLVLKRGVRHSRKFTAKNIEQLREIERLLKVEGYTLHGAKKKFNEDCDRTEVERFLRFGID